MSSHPFESNDTASRRRDSDATATAPVNPGWDDASRDERSIAVAGQDSGREAWHGAAEGDGLATFLGWFSLGLGAVELLAPHQLSRAIGLKPSGATTAVLQLFGVREVATGVGILANPTSKEWLGARVAGDLLDLATLGLASTRAERPGRTALAAGFVAGAGLLDLLATERLSEQRKALTAEEAAEPNPVVRRSTTVGRPVAEVYRFWREFSNLPRFMQHLAEVEKLDERRSRWRVSGPLGTSAEWESELTEERENELLAWQSEETSDIHHRGRVRFSPAPRNGGTIVTVEMTYAPPGGRIAAALLEILGHEPAQQLSRDLSRFKQLMETGEVLQTEATTKPGPAAGQPHGQREQ